MALLEDALALSAQARRVDAARADNEQRSRLRARLSDLQAAIDEVRSLLELHRDATVAGAEIAWRPTRLSSACRNLARVSKDGLPTEKHLDTAKSQVTVATNELTKAIGLGWTRWTEAQLASTPDEKIAALQGDERQAAAKDWTQLKKLAGKTPRTSRDVTEFVRLRERIVQAVRPVPNLSDELHDLLQRLDGKPALTLADLSDSNIAMLRKAGFASHVQLSRRLG